MFSESYIEFLKSVQNKTLVDKKVFHLILIIKNFDYILLWKSNLKEQLLKAGKIIKSHLKSKTKTAFVTIVNTKEELFQAFDKNGINKYDKDNFIFRDVNYDEIAAYIIKFEELKNILCAHYDAKINITYKDKLKSCKRRLELSDLPKDSNKYKFNIDNFLNDGYKNEIVPDTKIITIDGRVSDIFFYKHLYQNFKLMKDIIIKDENHPLEINDQKSFLSWNMENYHLLLCQKSTNTDFIIIFENKDPYKIFSIRSNECYTNIETNNLYFKKTNGYTSYIPFNVQKNKKYDILDLLNLVENITINFILDPESPVHFDFNKSI